jgi:hypothetical protein
MGVEERRSEMAEGEYLVKRGERLVFEGEANMAILGGSGVLVVLEDGRRIDIYGFGIESLPVEIKSQIVNDGQDDPTEVGEGIHGEGIVACYIGGEDGLQLLDIGEGTGGLKVLGERTTFSDEFRLKCDECQRLLLQEGKN